MGQQGKSFPIQFGAHGMVAHPNRWMSQPGEVTLAENVVFENNMVDKDPTSVYYNFGQAGTALGSNIIYENLFLAGTWDVPQANTLTDVIWVEAEYPVDPTGPAVQLAVGSLAPGAAWNIGAANNLIVGDTLFLLVSCEIGLGLATTVSDDLGLVWTFLGTNVSGGTMRCQIWGASVTVPGNATNITLAMFDAAADVNAIVIKCQDVTVPIRMVRFQDNAVAVQTWTTPTLAAAPAGLNAEDHRYPLRGIGVVAGSDTAPISSGRFGWAIPAGGQVQVGNHDTSAFTKWYPGNLGIIGQIDWASRYEKVGAAIPGTVSVTADNTLVTGAATTFLATFEPGDQIFVNGTNMIVDTITGNLTLRTVEPWAFTAAGAVYGQRTGSRLYTASLHAADTGATLLLLSREKPSVFSHGTKGDLWTNASFIAGSSATTQRRARFVPGGKEASGNLRKLFFLNGIHPVQVASTGGFATIANPAADWTGTTGAAQPLNAIVHADSLMAFGNENDPHRLYISAPTDHEDFRTAPASTGITMRIASQIGERLFGVAEYQGVLFLWKYPEGIFYLDDTSLDRYQWGYRIRSSKLGCAASPHAVLSIDDDVMFCDPQGHFHLLSAVNTLGGTRDSDMTRMLGLHRWTEENVHTASLNQMVSCFDRRTKTAWFGMRSTEAARNFHQNNDLIVRFEFASGKPRVSTSKNWVSDSLCTKRIDYVGTETMVIAGLGQAFIITPEEYGKKTDLNTHTSNGVDLGIPTQIDLPEHNFQEVDPQYRCVRKTFKSMEAIFADEDSAAEGITVLVGVDNKPRDVLQFQQAKTPVPGARHVMRTLSCGDGFTIRATIQTDGSLVTNMGLIGLVVYYEPTGTDMSRQS